MNFNARHTGVFLISQVEIDVVGGDFTSPTLLSFSDALLRDARYSLAPVASENQDGQQDVAGYAESFSCTLIQARRAPDLIALPNADYEWNALRGLADGGKVDVRLTATTGERFVMAGVRLGLSLELEKRKFTLPLSVRRMLTLAGAATDTTLARFGYGAANPIVNRFELPILSAVVTTAAEEYPFEASDFTRFERNAGLRRRCSVALSPRSFDAAYGVDLPEKFYRFLMSETKWLLLHEFNSLTDLSNANAGYRQVVKTTKEVAFEKRIGLFLSRSATMEFADAGLITTYNPA